MSAVSSREPQSSSETVNVSLGTAGLLGLQEVAQDALPTTAYLMVGGRCLRDCAFCAQARTSQARADALSRIVWPPHDLDLTITRLREAHEAGRLRRCCLQVTTAPGYLAQAERVLRRIRQASDIPLSVSAHARSLQDVRRLLDAGADRLGLALDAATPEVALAAKGPGWAQALDLLESAARAYPGRVSTHLIAGLGEQEREMVRLFQRLAEQGITIGLFAFTPVPGTALERRQPPALASYRRLQAARHLIQLGLVRAADMRFGEDGAIAHLGGAPSALRQALADGQAFRTSGCPDCNRPYYNERPGGVMYNYPRPLHPAEIAEAIALALAAPARDVSQGERLG